MTATKGKTIGRRANGNSGPDLAAGWAKLAPVLAAVGALVDAVERFRGDPDAAPLLADDGVSNELDNLTDTLPETVLLLSTAAAGVVAP